MKLRRLLDLIFRRNRDCTHGVDASTYSTFATRSGQIYESWTCIYCGKLQHTFIDLGGFKDVNPFP